MSDRKLDVAAGERTLFPADQATRDALTDWDEDRVLVRLEIPELTDSEQWEQATDLITGQAVAVRRADCGAGCRCAAEVKLVPAAHSGDALRFLLNEVLIAGHAMRQIDPGEVFTGMTCSEATALADVFAAAGDQATHDHIIQSHTLGDDDPEDEHHEGYLKAQKEMESWR